MRSTVLAPTDPVAPRIVTDRGVSAGDTLAADSLAPALIASPHQKAARRRGQPTTYDAENRRSRGRGQKAVETVHQTSMSGDDVTCVLHTESPFDRGFAQVPPLRDRRQHHSQHAERNDVWKP